LRYSPQINFLVDIVRLYHAECRVVKPFVYNLCYSKCGDVDKYLELNDIVRLDFPDYFTTFSPQVTHYLSSLYGPATFHAFLLNNGVYKINSVVYAHRPQRVIPKHYNSLFGPIFLGPWLVYEDTRLNLDLALTRITNCRRPTHLGPDDQLSLIQVRDFEFQLRQNCERTSFGGRRHHRLYFAFLTKVRNGLRYVLASFSDVFTQQKLYSEIPHEKRALRMAALSELITTAGLFGLFTKQVRGKIKLFERAKSGKYPRLIGDYTTPGSLLAGFLCEVAKKSLGVFVTPRGFKLEFCDSTNSERLDNIGTNLDEYPNDYCVYFSDDSAFKIDGKLFEEDISSCDMSNTEKGVFDVVVWLFQDFPHFRSVIKKCCKQCKLDLVCRDPNRSHWKLRFKNSSAHGCIEYSGTTLTTLLNCLAVAKIALRTHSDRAKDVAGMTRSAIASGYLVTIKPRSCIEQVQFLKYSFFRDDAGVMRSFLNLGPILRSFGTCYGDLPGRGDVRGRANNWNAVVVNGYVHSGMNSLLQALAKRYPVTLISSRIRLPEEILKHFRVGTSFEVPDHVIARRYECPTSWITEVSEILNGTTSLFRSVLNHPLIRRIYHVDYDLTESLDALPFSGVRLDPWL